MPAGVFPAGAPRGKPDPEATVAIIATDKGPIDLETVTKVEFVPGGSFPGTKKAVLDGTASAVALADVNAVRGAVGTGDGATGWVRVVSPGGGANDDVFVQLARVDEAARPAAKPVALKKGGASLGEVTAEALPAVDAKFPPHT